jgi:uncharacterized protein (UPF0261 family)
MKLFALGQKILAPMSLHQVIAMTLDSSTEEGGWAALECLEKGGWRGQVFDLRDGGGMAFESFIQRGQIVGVLDFTLTDLADTRLGGRDPSGPDRLTSAGVLGIPQIIVPGGLDHATFASPAPEAFNQHLQHQPNELTALVRTTAEDNDAFGKEIAYKASVSLGKVTIVFPHGGLSCWDGHDRPLQDPFANQALLESMYLWKTPQVKIIESHRHINDHHFAAIAAEHLLKLIGAAVR